MSVGPHDPTLDSADAEGVAASPSLARRSVLAGRYELRGLLGVGGMGAVYRALDLELDELVALKMLRRELTQADGALERFRREVKLARRVTHPNVARTFDIGRDEGGARFLTMELVDGPSLARRLVDQRLPSAEVLRIAGAVCEGLRAAHAVDVVHLDLKPDNVLTAGERVVVTDFGIARYARGDAARTGGIVGTPAYMAPEQVLGTPTDPRADLYAFGLLLFEMLAGTPAFVGDSPLAVASARLVRPPPDLAEHRPDLPPALVTLVRELLAREPEGRPESAAAVLERLAGVEPARSSLRPGGALASAVASRTLAMVPLRWSGEPGERWIADGIGEDLEDALCAARGLRVRAASERGPEEDTQAWGRRQGVELVLDGSVRRAGAGVRISLRLTSTEDGFRLWAERFEGALEELLVMSDRAAASVAEAAGRARVAPATRATSAEAVELYLRALSAMRGSMATSGEDPRRLLTRAAQLAPDDARVHATLAIAHLVSGFSAEAVEADGHVEAREHAERALQLAPELVEPWVALARVHFAQGNSPEAARALHRALRHGVSNALAQDFGVRFCAELDLADDARRHARNALWIDPNRPFVRLELLRLDALDDAWDAVVEGLGELRAISPMHAALGAVRFSVWRGRRLVPLPEIDLPPEARLMDGVFDAEGAYRGVDEVLAHFGTLRSKLAGERLGRRLYLQLEAEVAARGERWERALEAMGLALDDGLEDVGWIQRCPLFEGLREDARFQRMRAELEARAAPAIAAWRASVA
ncbi:MAG: protein kinase [Myxococcota bacterium]